MAVSRRKANPLSGTAAVGCIGLLVQDRFHGVDIDGAWLVIVIVLLALAGLVVFFTQESVASSVASWLAPQLSAPPPGVSAPADTTPDLREAFSRSLDEIRSNQEKLNKVLADGNFLSWNPRRNNLSTHSWAPVAAEIARHKGTMQAQDALRDSGAEMRRIENLYRDRHREEYFYDGSVYAAAQVKVEDSDRIPDALKVLAVAEAAVRKALEALH